MGGHWQYWSICLPAASVIRSINWNVNGRIALNWVDSNIWMFHIIFLFLDFFFFFWNRYNRVNIFLILFWDYRELSSAWRKKNFKNYKLKMIFFASKYSPKYILSVAVHRCICPNFNKTFDDVLWWRHLTKLSLTISLICTEITSI